MTLIKQPLLGDALSLRWKHVFDFFSGSFLAEYPWTQLQISVKMVGQRRKWKTRLYYANNSCQLLTTFKFSKNHSRPFCCCCCCYWNWQAESKMYMVWNISVIPLLIYSQWPISRTLTISSAGKDVEHSHSLLVEMQDDKATLVEILVVSCKTKHILTIWCSKSTWYLLKGTENVCPYKLCTQMSRVVFFIIEKTWKWPRCPLLDEWINCEYNQTMHYYIAWHYHV